MNKRLLLAFGLLAATVPLVLTARGSSDHATLLRLDHDLGEALVDGDLRRVRELCLPDYQYTSSRGVVTGLDERLESLRSGKLDYLETEHDDVRVRIHRSTAVVTGRARSHFIFEGVEARGSYRYLTVWFKVGGEWRAAATQSTKIAD
jgi:hypothetical protein